MKYFFDTIETIPQGVGWEYFSGIHLVWLALFVAFAVYMSMLYRRSDTEKRAKIRKMMSWLIIGDEIFKMIMLAIGDRYMWDYLPLHLCSINIFIIAYHARRPNKMLDNFLYAICIPGALAALLTPTWYTLPLFNFMHLHSFTVHILLVTYPVMLLASGEIVPDIKIVPKCILFVLIMAIPIYGINLLLDTNFMFLMFADPGNPLLLFEDIFGWHLIGVPIIESVVVFILYTPYYIIRSIKNKASHA